MPIPTRDNAIPTVVSAPSFLCNGDSSERKGGGWRDATPR